jgi:hypothetical protein
MLDRIAAVQWSAKWRRSRISRGLKRRTSWVCFFESRQMSPENGTSWLHVHSLRRVLILGARLALVICGALAAQPRLFRQRNSSICFSGSAGTPFGRSER